MKFSALILPALALTFTLVAQSAPVVELKGTPGTLQGVNVYPEATVQTTKGPVELKLTGRGTRTKLGGFVKVYVASSYVADLEAWRKATGEADVLTQPDRASLMSAVEAQPVRVLVLTMLDALSSSQIQKSFGDSLKANGVAADAPGVKDVLSRFNVNLKKGESVVIATFPDGDKQQLTIEAQGRLEHVTAENLGTNFWKIWFRKGDNELMTLQKALVGSK